MKTNKNSVVVDLFNEEINRKQKKEDKKIAKMRAKEKKKEDKKNKKLEKLEDIEFARKVKEKDTEERIIEQVKKEQNKELKKEKKINNHPFLNFLLTIFIIGLFLITTDYLVFNVIKGNNLEQIINSSLLCVMVVFYILSIIIKNIGFKKFFQLLATLAIGIFMAYHLWII